MRTQPATVFVDAMGGDLAPKVNLRGALQAIQEKNIHVVLVGDSQIIGSMLAQEISNDSSLAKKAAERIRIEHASEVIEMHEHPAQAVRSKKDSSINVGIKLSGKTPHSAFLSAGNSGAVLAAAIMHLKRINGVDRPAIAARLPTTRGFLLLIDAGANTQCKASQLVQFGLMGSAYFLEKSPRAKGRIGVLSNGAEDTKGNDLTRETHQEFQKLVDDKKISSELYAGYVEGGRLFHGGVDVVVCDGFTGNLVLKSLEGLASAVTDMMKAEIKKDWLATIGLAFAMRALRKLKQKTDYAEVGGAPLLGVNGHVFIAHGRSQTKAIKNAILHAAESAAGNLPERLEQVILQTQ